jgi:hypothetical protein
MDLYHTIVTAMLRSDKDCVEISIEKSFVSVKFTKILSDLNLIVILIIYTEEK